MSEIHRRRCGAPAGFATLYGVHIPFEHRDPLAYWAAWLALRYGRHEAEAFVRDTMAQRWTTVPALRALYEQKLEVARTKKAIRNLSRKALRDANKNRR